VGVNLQDDLAVPVTRALQDEKVRSDLKKEHLSVEDAKTALCTNGELIARFEAERITFAQNLPIIKTAVHPYEKIPHLAGGDYVWLALSFGVLFGYHLLIVLAWPSLPWLLAAADVVGYFVVLLVVGQISYRHVRPLSELFDRMVYRVILEDPDDFCTELWHTYALETIVRPAVDEFLRKPPYSTTLSFRAVENLYTETSAGFSVMTSAGMHLRNAIARSTTGAIALAGHRGVGKTTAIRHVAAGMLGDSDQVSVPPPLAVIASAPARYDARDFVLYVYALLCKEVFNLTFDKPSVNDHFDRRPMFTRLSFPIARRGRILGAIRFLLVNSLAIATIVLLGSWTWGKSPMVFITDPPAIFTDLNGWRIAVLVLAGLTGLILTLELGTLIMRLIYIATAGAIRFLRRERILGAIRFLLGSSLAIATIVLLGSWTWGKSPVVFITDPPAIFTDLNGWRIAVLVLAGLTALILTLELGELIYNLATNAIQMLREPRNSTLLGLRAETKKQLRRIQFLQTYTSGWSGRLMLPLKTEAGWTRANQSAEQQLTYPEVVDSFRAFAEGAAGLLRKAKVIESLVIAIDELDKIANAEQAHELINEIKGIFDVPGCLFLVSVSDDAVIAFERRGIPARDAFDSAFSEMIRLENFTLDDTRNWIRRRIFGLPDQFACLCHCLSGGLPRDLRRTAVELVDISRIYLEEPATLSMVARDLIRREIKRKANAFIGAARNLENSPGRSNLIAELMALPAQTEHNELRVLASKIRPGTDNARVTALHSQIATYLLFCATICEVFTDETTEDRLYGILGDKPEDLAIARQQMAFDPNVSWDLLVRFRDARNLKLLED
jgi:hypothetical protein